MTIYYQDITTTIIILNDYTGEDMEVELTMSYTSKGFTDAGTYLFEDHPTDEELSHIEGEKADWAVHKRFEDFANEVAGRWTDLQAMCKEKGFKAALQEARDYLKAEDNHSANALLAGALQVIKALGPWIQKQALLTAVPAQTATTATTFKI